MAETVKPKDLAVVCPRCSAPMLWRRTWGQGSYFLCPMRFCSFHLSVPKARAQVDARERIERKVPKYETRTINGQLVKVAVYESTVPKNKVKLSRQAPARPTNPGALDGSV